MKNNAFKDHILKVTEEVEKWPAWKRELLTITEEEIQMADDEEPEYDSPNGSVWIVAVDHAGRVSVLETPNIHYALLENGPEAEYLGLPPDVDDMDPGVYRWTCSYHTHTDRESGLVDDYDFEIEESVLLWSPDNA